MNFQFQYDTAQPVFQGHIDPFLQQNSPILGDTDPWSHPQAYSRHYSVTHENTSYMNSGAGRLQGTAPVPPAAVYPGRSYSSDQQSSICSNDSIDNPSTPPDVMLSPPAAPFEQWSNQTGHLVYLADHLADHVGCIKPDVISYYPDSQPTFVDEDPKFALRCDSMSSNCSTFDMDFQSHQPEPSPLTRTMSPAEMCPPIKQEKSASEHYPSPPANEDYENHSEDGSDQPNAGDDDDEEYKPNVRRSTKRNSAPTSRRTAQHKRSNTAQTNSPNKRTKREPASPAAPRSIPKVSPIVARGAFSCTECREVAFKDHADLQRHIKQQHTRPFVCVFHFAQCESTFASKNEWKRHVASQHLLLNYWLCQQDGCAKLSNTSGSLTKATGTTRHRSSNNSGSQDTCWSGLPNGAIFNRKDLYTQHLRRMHSPPAVKKQTKAKKPVPEWEDRIRSCQTEAHKLRCALPDYMKCPMPGCDFEAAGLTAWDERMEHVAKHLEKAASGHEAQITFGGDNDPTLMNWVIRPDVAVVKADGHGRWALNNPLKPERSGKGQAQTHAAYKQIKEEDYDDEQDAPGEIDD
ncbi:hypothetical protein BJ166DRAFT_226718 [Pestalotiopsis sp. NC0098]|nr:hypothetical protein BJ166DRAFT_226718 [Pestalotiopsis sp. NC0098]